MKKSVLSMLAVAALVLWNDFLQRSQENKRRS